MVGKVTDLEYKAIIQAVVQDILINAIKDKSTQEETF